MAIRQTEAFVIKIQDFRETSRIARFFSRDFGRISGVMKGIRKDPRKFGSGADVYSLNEIVYYEYSRSDLHLISQCDLKEYYFPIRQDYARSVAANYAVELIDVIMPAGESNLDVYALLKNFFQELTTARDIGKLIHIFQVKILHLSGFSPHLDSCVRTGRKIDGRARFSTQLGGLIAPEVSVMEHSFTMISKGTIRTILHLEEASWNEALRLGFDAPIRKELKFILNHFLVYHLEKKIRSAKYVV
jgi:DNA repair protein RecO (recombination protein O)